MFSSHHLYDFTDWYVLIGFMLVASVALGAYVKFLESREIEDDEKWK